MMRCSKVKRIDAGGAKEFVYLRGFYLPLTKRESIEWKNPSFNDLDSVFQVITKKII